MALELAAGAQVQLDASALLTTARLAALAPSCPPQRWNVPMKPGTVLKVRSDGASNPALERVGGHVD